MVDVTLQRYIVYFCRSTDDGDTWEGYQCLASGLQSYPEPSITAANDSVRVAFHKDTGSWKDLIYKASGDNGTTWAPPDYISYGQNDHYPHIIMVNNIPHVVLLRIYGPGNTYILHAKPNPFSPVWEKSQIMNYGEYQYPLLAIDEQNRLHAIWERSDYSIWYARSLNNGDSWQDIEILSTSSAGSYLTTYWQGVFVVYQNVNDICGRLSTDFGASWGNQFIIDDYADTYEANCCIVNGHRTRHLIFQKLISAPDDYDLVYMANDDSLLSNSNRATAFNGGRHLLRDPFCNSLHLVYHSQERVHYSFSNDGGTTWAPYHIIEDSETQNKDYGWYPSVALIPGMLTMKPCVVYCSNLGEVKYRWLNEGTGQWQGFTILEAAEGHDPGPPSVVTYGDQVYMIFSVNHLDQGEQLWSAIYFYQFSYDATGAPDPITLDYTPFGPLAYSHVSITVDGNGDPHCVWEKKISPNNWQDIFYRWREGVNWHSVYPVSDQPDFRSKSPHIDDYGDFLSVVWYNEIAGTPDEIYRRRKRIPRPRWSAIGLPYSQSPGIVSEFPVNAADNFTVWSEKPGIEFDIRYRSDTYGFGWVSQAPERESFCHGQLQRGYYPWDLYTIFTKGDRIPYRIGAVHQQFGGGDPDINSPLYTVETGKDTASVFCVQRESPIQYGGYQVDYAASELIYALPLLEPIFPYHLIKGIGYFEGTGNKLHEIWVNNEKKFAFVVNANQPFNFEIPIPRELYQNEHRITVSIKNPQSNGVYLADLEICRLIDGRHGGGGPQSTNTLSVVAEFTLLPNTPNPFVKTTNISYQTQKSCKVFLKIYDIAGQLINTLVHEHQNSGFHTARWDGRDAGGREVSNGIYFIELKSDNESITKKVIKLR